MLKSISKSFPESNGTNGFVHVPVKIPFFGRRTKDEVYFSVGGYLTKDVQHMKAIETINPNFIKAVSEFLEKEPNNEYAQRITKTIVKGAQFE